MDLRMRLVASLGGVLALLLVVFAAVVVVDGRRDAADEVSASRRLAEVSLALARLQHLPAPQAEAEAEKLLAAGGLRHVRLSWADAGDMPEAPHQPWPWSLGRMPEGAAESALVIPVGQRLMRLQADPAAEWQENLADSRSLMLTLLAFAVAGLGLIWYLAHRALAPVRALLEGLQRVEQGRQAALPDFELREFQRLAEGIAHLEQSLEQSRAEQQRLTHRLLEVQEAERRELARELHDELGQALTAMSINAGYIERNAGRAEVVEIQAAARDLGGQARALGDQVRSLLSRLRPHGLEGVGLLQGMQELLQGWRQRVPEVQWSSEMPESLPVVDNRTGLALYRCLQEALTNVLRHSGADRCRIVLKQDSGGLSLAVCDNGRGRVGQLAHSLGCGLMGMRERLAMVGGRLQLVDMEPAGLGLSAWLPLRGGVA